MSDPNGPQEPEVERMMKLQDLLFKAMAKKITWWQAAEIIGLSDRTTRRWRKWREDCRGLVPRGGAFNTIRAC